MQVLARVTTALLVTMSLLLTSGVSRADAQITKTRITDTAFVALPGNRIELRFDFDAPPPLPRSYMIENPARLVVDLWGATNGLGTKSIDIKSGQVDRVDLAEVFFRPEIGH